MGRRGLIGIAWGLVLVAALLFLLLLGDDATPAGAVVAGAVAVAGCFLVGYAMQRGVSFFAALYLAFAAAIPGESGESGAALAIAVVPIVFVPLAAVAAAGWLIGRRVDRRPTTREQPEMG